MAVSLIHSLIVFANDDCSRLSPGQYCYVNVPWISHTQWHPFSVMPEIRCPCMHVSVYMYLQFGVCALSVAVLLTVSGSTVVHNEM
jgi:hypothetical protein